MIKHIVLACYYTAMKEIQQIARPIDLLNVRIHVLRRLHGMQFSNPCNRAFNLEHWQNTKSDHLQTCKAAPHRKYRSNASIFHVSDPVSIHDQPGGYGFLFFSTTTTNLSQSFREIDPMVPSPCYRKPEDHEYPIGHADYQKNAYEYSTNSIELM